jgi:hypothetical protein
MQTLGLYVRMYSLMEHGHMRLQMVLLLLMVDESMQWLRVAVWQQQEPLRIDFEYQQSNGASSLLPFLIH